MEEEYSPAELIKERQRRVDEMNGLVALPAGITARQFMQMVMRGEIDPLPKQMNAAKVLIEYEEAKLTAVAVGHMDGTSFAAQLERCLARSEAARAKASLRYLPLRSCPRLSTLARKCAGHSFDGGRTFASNALYSISCM